MCGVSDRGREVLRGEKERDEEKKKKKRGNGKRRI